MTKQEQFVADITASVTAAIEDRLHQMETALRDEIKSSGCPVDSDERRAIPDLYSMIREIGDDNIRVGMTRIKRYFLFIESLYNKKAVMTGAVFSLTIIALIGWLVLWTGKGLICGAKTVLGIGQ